MPYASEKQKHLMQAVANSPGFAKKVGIPQSVGQKFEAHKAKGGEIMASKKLFGGKESYAEELKEAKAIKSGRITPQQYARGEREEERSMKKMKKFSFGGDVVTQPFEAIPVAPGGGAEAAMGRAAQARRAMVNAALGPRPTGGMAAMKKGGTVKKMAKGGFAVTKMGSVKTASPSRDGIASKGKTKGTMVKMAGGKGMKSGGKC